MTRTCIGVLSFLAAGSLAAACGGDGGGSGNASGGDPAKKTLALLFSPVMYSAYDGEHTFKLPVIASNAPGKVTYKAADESMVDITPTADGAMLTMRKAGTTTIIGTAPDGTWGESTLVISQASPANYELGKQRYDNGVVAFEGDDPGGPDDGPPEFDPESACSFCHRPDGMSGSGTADEGMIDIEHTPQQTGGYSDQQIIDIFTKGQKPPGAGARVIPLQFWSMLHKWNVEANVEQGIVTYLRALEPKSQGEVDFGPDGPGGGPGGPGGGPGGPGGGSDAAVGGAGDAGMGGDASS